MKEYPDNWRRKAQIISRKECKNIGGLPSSTWSWALGLGLFSYRTERVDCPESSFSQDDFSLPSCECSDRSRLQRRPLWFARPRPRRPDDGARQTDS